MNKDAIKTLDTRQQCREKLPIFFGSRDNYIHGIKEVIANAIDEISNNFENGKIHISLSEDLKTISVKDSGRGIPINKKTDGKPNYVLLFETLFAGSNFENNESKKITVGTNGCGTCVLNHTSEFFKVTSSRDGKIFELLYEGGGKFISFKEVGKSNETYSIFEFKLDPEVYTNTIYNVDELKNICKYNAAVNNKISIIFSFNNEEFEYHYDSIEEYFNEITQNKTSNNIVGVMKKYDEGSEENNIILSLSTSSDPIQQTFLNSNYLPNNGSIYDGVINGVKLFTNKYIKDKKLIDKKLGSISNNDIIESISFVTAIESTNVEYENQIKLSTQKKLYKNIAQKYIQELLEIELIERPKNLEKFIKHILEVQKFNNKAQANKAALKKKLSEKVDSIANRIEGLVDCKNYGEDSELYIAEGKSALGSIVLSRDARFQAAMAIRGKIANCLKMNYQDIFKNQVVTDIIKALGCGIETDKKNKDLGEFDENSLRYGKIILATDADPDGFQIQCLLLSLFYKLTPTLIKNERIYIAVTPLYEVRLKDDTNIYWFSESEKDEYVLKNGSKNIKKMSRCKGLGELDCNVMAETGVNPETRNIIKVTVEDVEMMIKMFDTWMGDNPTERHKLLTTELNKFDTEY